MELNFLKVDGGASANNFLMQAQADMIQVPVKRPVCVETTAMGAAYLAGLAVGYWNSKEEIIENWSTDRVFYPELTKEEEIKRQRLEKGSKIVPTDGQEKINFRKKMS